MSGFICLLSIMKATRNFIVIEASKDGLKITRHKKRAPQSEALKDFSLSFYRLPPGASTFPEIVLALSVPIVTLPKYTSSPSWNTAV